MNPEPGKSVQYVYNNISLHTGNRRGRRTMNVSYSRDPRYKKY